MPPPKLPPPGWKQRLLAVAFYFGLAPWLWRYCLRGERGFLKRHFFQSLAIASLFLALLVFYVLLYAASAYLLIHHHEFYRALSRSSLFRLATGSLLHVLLLGWAAVWLAGIWLAARGSVFELPVIAAMSRSRVVVSISFLACSPVYLSLVFAVGVAFHSSTLTDRVMHSAPVYMLYDDLGYVPRWVFDFAFHRVSRIAAERWGPGHTVVAPLTKENLETALQNGRFVFVASHGDEGRLITSGFSYGPEDARKLRIGKNLQLVYLAACHGGEKSAEWEKALKPARVITFPRKSYTGEHLYWLWTQGPAAVIYLR